jgi:hypothetical protein
MYLAPDEDPAWTHLPEKGTQRFVDQSLDGAPLTFSLATQADEMPEIVLAVVKGADEDTHPLNQFATSVANAYGDGDVYGPAILLAMQDGDFTDLTDRAWTWVVNVESGLVAAPVKPAESTPVVSFRELLAANRDTVTDDTEVIITAGELRERLDELGRLRVQAEEDAALVGWYLHFDETPYESRLAVLCNHFGPRAKAALEARATAVLANANTPT